MTQKLLSVLWSGRKRLSKLLRDKHQEDPTSYARALQDIEFFFSVLLLADHLLVDLLMAELYADLRATFGLAFFLSAPDSEGSSVEEAEQKNSRCSGSLNDDIFAKPDFTLPISVCLEQTDLLPDQLRLKCEKEVIQAIAENESFAKSANWSNRLLWRIILEINRASYFSFAVNWPNAWRTQGLHIVSLMILSLGRPKVGGRRTENSEDSEDSCIQCRCRHPRSQGG